ncbi:MAG TPA: sigma 54-interacting transcriptional regulator [Burkholderiales bacterium]|nr:sigma 54-interacting transcriptional regulator [Burkholderiales bacterium]
MQRRTEEINLEAPMDLPWSGEAKYRALLAVAQAAHSRRDLSAVLDAVATAFEELVPVDLIAVVTHEPDAVRARAVYLRNVRRRPGEAQDAYVRRVSEGFAGATGTSWHHTAFLRDALERDRRTVVLGDVATDTRLEGSGVKVAGAECAVLVPLSLGEEFVAAMVFARAKPAPFLPDEVGILEDVAGPVATAVANALAFEEIQKLRSQLEDENVALREEIAATATAAGAIIGASRALREVLERVALVAVTDSTVLITGETGTGKELVARAIHAGSRRAKRAMVKVNCAAMPEALIASELFGHEKGAFTGALERRRGRFELAAGGTIFLDEVSELPPPVQVALLRVLQEREFERVGSSETLRTDARIVAATNRNLEEAAREGKFRSDLFYRLNVFPIRVPTLRERADDIPILAEYWASRCSRHVGKAIREIDKSAMAALCAYPWPGNIRELQNTVERAVILARGHVLGLADFELPGLGSEAVRAGGDDPGDQREQIERALEASRGRVYGADGAAETLGVPPSTLEARIRRLGIDKHAFRRPRSRPVT